MRFTETVDEPVWTLFGVVVKPDGEAWMHGQVGGSVRRVYLRLWFGAEPQTMSTNVVAERLGDVLGGRVEYAGGDFFRLDEDCLSTIKGWQSGQHLWSDWADVVDEGER